MDSLLFCPNSSFEQEVVNILLANLFNSPIQSLPGAFPRFYQLNSIYAQMKKYLNCPSLYNLYHADGNCLNRHFKDQIYYGHDFPIWLNDPLRNDFRLMLVGECPRRKDNEMYDSKNTTPQLSISSPFGIHSTYWRRGKNGIVPHVMQEIIRKAKEKCDYALSVYITDAYKLCNSNGYVSLKRNSVYKDILCEEIKLYNPNYIIAFGAKANNLLCQTLKRCACLNQIKHTGIKHPSLQTAKKLQSEIENLLRPELCKDTTKK